jgi:hypothetical protein
MGYLEWGKDNGSFLFQMEAEIFSTLSADPTSVIHPFIILPVAGQIVLFITLFQKRPNKYMTLTGMAGIGILLVFMFVIGLISLRYKIVVSTIPFLSIAFLTISQHRNK